MKVSVNLAQYYSNVDLRSIPRDELLQRIGAQLGAVEQVTDWAAQFDGAIIVKVVSCEDHPNADKLHVCTVDDGSGNTAQVVCGAPNVRAGMYAVWLKPGVTVPSSRASDPFVLEAREIRGTMSNGMLASAKELGISEDHNGILEITENDVMSYLQFASSNTLTVNNEQSEDHNGESQIANILPLAHSQSSILAPGTRLTEIYGLDDFVIDCENKMFTHRPDCFGNLGVARELAGISGLAFTSPDWYLETPQFENVENLKLEVQNTVEEVVPRFMAVVMENVDIKPSPIWMQASLTRVGIKPINNVVDVTNFVMHLTGQPLHAFDYDKLVARSDTPSLMPRMSQKGEKLTLLGGKEIELSGSEIVIATDKQAVALAGVMGGADTEVDSHTKNIVIECATFDMYTIRKTSMRFGIFTEAVTRYSKGQSPAQNDRILAYAMQKMAEVAGAKQASAVHDIGRFLEPGNTVETSVGFVNKRLGSQLSGQDMCQLLQNVEFETESDGTKLVVKAPFWRMDIVLPEDIVEEIGRLYGYNLLPVQLPKRSAKAATKNLLFEFKQQLRLKLKEAGANEVLTYSFVHGDLLRKTGVDPDASAYHLRNAISPDLQFYRTSLLASLLTKVHPNIKSGAGSQSNQFALFEIGKAHVKGHESDGLPDHMERLALVISADDKTALSQQNGAPYYVARKFLDFVTDGQATYNELQNDTYPITSAYQLGRSAEVKIGDLTLGVIGEFKPGVIKALKLPASTAGFELDMNLLLQNLQPKMYQPLPEFPAINQDVTLASDNNYAETFSQLQNSLRTVSSEHGYEWSVTPLDIYKKDGESTRFSFRLSFWHPKRTLTTDEISRLVIDITKNT